MRGRALLAGLALLLAGPGLAPGAAAPPAPWFAEAEYAAYFRPGRYRVASEPQDSRGLAEILVSGPVRGLGARAFRMAMSSVETFPAYDPSSLPFYKVRAEGELVLLWDPARRDYFYDYPPEAFDQDASEVFLSASSIPEILPEDRPAGALQAFYRNADRRAGRDPDAMEAAHRAAVAGLWRMACRKMTPGGPFEVECRLTHVPSGRAEWRRYRRADLIG